MPSFNTTGTNTVKYCYSVIGNTMYIDFTYYSTGSGGTAGSGKYIFLIPSGYTPNTTFTTPYALSSSQTNPAGSIIGSANSYAYSFWNLMGGVWLVQHSTSSIGICLSANATLSGTDNTPYNSSATALSYTFTCTSNKHS
jgi:hypothetical protein